MPEGKNKKYSRSIICGILNDLNNQLRENGNLPKNQEFSEKYGIPWTTIYGWFKRYGTAEKVPEKNVHSQSPAIPPLKSALINPPKIKKSNSYPQAAKIPVPFLPNPYPEPEPENLRLIIAELYLENRCLKSLLYGKKIA